MKHVLWSTDSNVIRCRERADLRTNDSMCQASVVQQATQRLRSCILGPLRLCYLSGYGRNFINPVLSFLLKWLVYTCWWKLGMRNRVTDQALNNIPTFPKGPQKLRPTFTLTPPNHVLYLILSQKDSKGRPPRKCRAQSPSGPQPVGPKQVYTAQPFAMPRVGEEKRKA